MFLKLKTKGNLTHGYIIYNYYRIGKADDSTNQLEQYSNQKIYFRTWVAGARSFLSSMEWDLHVCVNKTWICGPTVSLLLMHAVTTQRRIFSICLWIRRVLAGYELSPRLNYSSFLLLGFLMHVLFKDSSNKFIWLESKQSPEFVPYMFASFLFFNKWNLDILK